MTRHTTRLKVDVINDLTTGPDAPFTSVNDLALKAGMSASTLYRVIGGTLRPGTEFIASLIEATDLTYEDLFTREPVTPKRDGPPRPRRRVTPPKPTR